MDGVIVIDKPSGPTSHDVVARARRALREKRVGHTGTLDPLASGVLPLVIGRATRLARFLTASHKTYDATIQLGVTTDTADAQGEPVGDPFEGPWPVAADVDAALDLFRGTFPQQPPAYSAKKIDGERSYRLARQGRADLARPAPVEVTTFGLDLLQIEHHTIVVRVHCSAGFYVRSLAHDLGERLGTGGHLTALRRTGSGVFTIDNAIPLSLIDDASEADRLSAALIPLSGLLHDRPAVVLNDEGDVRARHGRDISAEHLVMGEEAQRHLPAATSSDAPIRLLTQTGDLLGLALRKHGSETLHPAVVLV
jgi:tRNA pseudouridine55 synthase